MGRLPAICLPTVGKQKANNNIFWEPFFAFSPVYLLIVSILLDIVTKYNILFHWYVNTTSLTDFWLQKLFALLHCHTISHNPVTKVLERLEEVSFIIHKNNIKPKVFFSFCSPSLLPSLPPANSYYTVH